MNYYRISLDESEPLDARIEIYDGSVILQSRSGRPPRNTQYANALEVICSRVCRDPRTLKRVLSDSRPARELSEEKRVLIEQPEISLLTPADLVRVIRYRSLRFNQAEGVTGGNSTKQIRFDVSLHEPEIVSLLGLQLWRKSESPTTEEDAATRLSAAVQRTVTTLHIRAAVDRLLAGEDAPQFAGSREYDVIVEGGHRLAPKKVFGLALEAALGMRMTPRHFSAGLGEPCFELLEAAGYRIVEKADIALDAPTEMSGPLPIPADDEERGWAEGSLRIVQHFRMERRRDPAAAAAKRRDVRASNGGRLICENPACTADWYAIFPEAVAEAVFEVHHVTAIAAMAPDHLTTIQDLRCFCAACHKAEHRRMALLREA